MVYFNKKTSFFSTRNDLKSLYNLYRRYSSIYLNVKIIHEYAPFALSSVLCHGCTCATLERRIRAPTFLASNSRTPGATPERYLASQHLPRKTACILRCILISRKKYQKIVYVYVFLCIYVSTYTCV